MLEVTREEAERWTDPSKSAWPHRQVALARTVVALYDERDALQDAVGNALREWGSEVHVLRAERDDARSVLRQNQEAITLGKAENTTLRACLLRLRDGKWEAHIEHGQWITRASYDEHGDPCFETEPMTEAEQTVMRGLT